MEQVPIEGRGAACRFRFRCLHVCRTQNKLYSSTIRPAAIAYDIEHHLNKRIWFWGGTPGRVVGGQAGGRGGGRAGRQTLSIVIYTLRLPQRQFHNAFLKVVIRK